MSILLRVDGLQVGYGDMTAVHEATLEVAARSFGAVLRGLSLHQRRFWLPFGQTAIGQSGTS